MTIRYVSLLYVVHCDHASIWHRYEDYAASNVGRTHRRTDAQVILYAI